mmetsp:Transcript_38821/g.96221  ORF Transcript_38821/g.96221 Transcript_38821/m.96221 type:complete len:103 (-) Transcript_38821:149-457(-)
MVCNRAAKVCKTKPPPLAPGRVDHAFRTMTNDEKSMADMMANLKDSGMGGTMYKREELMKGMAGMEDKMAHIAEEHGMDTDALERAIAQTSDLEPEPRKSEL